MTKNAYIHIPFCAKKCFYCSFVSFNKLPKKSQYLEALTKEIASNYYGEKLSTLYIGGGTPSLLSDVEVNRILSLFKFEKDAEITIEVNPNKLNSEYLKALHNMGINRISIGAQTFDEDILKQIGRLHKSADIQSAVSAARDAGFDNLSLDLIYGLPNQTLRDFEASLKSAAELNVEHISLYGLKIEEGSYFYSNKPEKLAGDELQADMYLLAGDFLRQKGYEKYEISNFAREGCYSRHNINYWNANTYYGFGCGAHGYENGIRYENETDLDKYIENPLIKPASTKLTPLEMLEEKIFLGLRKSEGINLKEIKEQFNYDLAGEKGAVIIKFLDSGHMVRTADGYAFSDEGFLLSDYILGQIL